MAKKAKIPKRNKYPQATDAPLLAPKTNGSKRSLYDDDKYPDIARQLCELFGADNIQLGKVFGVSHITVRTWRENHPDLNSAIKAGKDVYDSRQVEDSLLRRALGFAYDEVTVTQITLPGKDKNGTKVRVPAIKTAVTKKQVVPDVGAMCFWLKNRQPERWKDIKQTVLQGGIAHDHKHKGKVEIDDSADRTAQVLAILQESGIIAVGGEQPGVAQGGSTKTH
jgi:hypothetical protein